MTAGETSHLKINLNGASLMLISVAFFSVAHLLVKYVDGVSFYQLVFFRALMTLSFSFLLLRLKKKTVRGNNYKKLFLRGLAGSVALIMFFFSLQNLPLATAITLQNLAPIFTIIMSALFLKEKLSLYQMIAFVGAFIGVVLIKGFDSNIAILPFVLGVVSPLFSGIAYTIIRDLRSTDSPLVIIFYFSLVSLMIVSPYTLYHWVTPSVDDLMLILAMGVATILAQICMTEGLQRGSSAKVVIVNYLGVILAAIYGIIIFSESLNIYTYLGIGLILVCIYVSQIKAKRYNRTLQ